MRIYHFLLTLLLSFVFQISFAGIGDTTYVPVIKYKKAELKKEIKEVKAAEKQIKVWQKAVKQKNTDYLNTVFSKTLKLLEKEHSELSNRISIRSKQLTQTSVQTQTPNKASEDKPQVYNPELKDQVVHVNKADIMRKKAESEYLGKYIDVIRNQKTLLNKLKNVKTFDAETNPIVYETITKDFQDFKTELHHEIRLMKTETGKK